MNDHKIVSPPLPPLTAPIIVDDSSIIRPRTRLGGGGSELHLGAQTVSNADAETEAERSQQERAAAAASAASAASVVATGTGNHQQWQRKPMEIGLEDRCVGEGIPAGGSSADYSHRVEDADDDQEERHRPPPAARCQRRRHRYATVDFVRGLAILFMLGLHIIADTLDFDYYLSNLGTGAAINLLALLILPFYGGLAGLFLLTSSVGNAIGMSANLRRGRGSDVASSVAKKQVTGGMILVAFATVAEAFLCNHGALGDASRNLHVIFTGNYELTSWRVMGLHVETLHAIGWCTAINGVVHCLLARRYGCGAKGGDYDGRERILRAYGVLAVLTLCLTPLVWGLVEWFIPGYPYDTDATTGYPVYLPVLGTSPWYDFVLFFFVNPFSAPVEPVLPYLATSFVGSMIGVHLARNVDSLENDHSEAEYPERACNNDSSGEYILHVDDARKDDEDGGGDEASNEEGRDLLHHCVRNHGTTSFVRHYLLASILSFIVGTSGLILLFFRLGNLDAALEAYQQIYDHRAYTASHFDLPLGWLFQFLALNGFSVAIFVMTLRLVECRGAVAVQNFAEGGTFVRRFGFVALSVYVLQWVYNLVHFVVSLVYPGVWEAYGRLPWFGSWIVVTLTILSFHFALQCWERCGYFGSTEWFLLSVATWLSNRGDEGGRMAKQVAAVADSSSFPVEARNFASEEDEDCQSSPCRCLCVCHGRASSWCQSRAGVRLDVEGIFYHPQWVAFPPKIDRHDMMMDDLKLAKVLSVTGFLFPPLSVMGFRVLRDIEERSQIEEGAEENRGYVDGSIDDARPIDTEVDLVDIWRWRWVSMAGILFFALWLVVLCVVSPSDLGLNM